MTAAVIWLIAGLVLIAAEVLSGEFVLLMIGGGALAAAGASALVGDDPLVGVGVFAVASVLLLFAVRPALRRRLDRGIDHGVMHHRGAGRRTRRSWSAGSTSTAARSRSAASCGRRGRSTDTT